MMINNSTSLYDWSWHEYDICITTYFNIGLISLITSQNCQHKQTSSTTLPRSALATLVPETRGVSMAGGGHYHKYLQALLHL